MTDNPYPMDDWKYWLHDTIEDSKEELERAINKRFDTMIYNLNLYHWEIKKVRLKNYFNAIDFIQKHSFPGCAIQLHPGGTTYIRTWDEENCMFAIPGEASSEMHISKIVPEDIDPFNIEFWHTNITNRYL